LIGVLGFIPGNDTMHVAGHQFEAWVLGVFQVYVVHLLLAVGMGGVGRAPDTRAVWPRYPAPPGFAVEPGGSRRVREPGGSSHGV
jgi:hypothetical protein